MYRDDKIYFARYFLFVIIRTSARSASTNNRKENDNQNKSHNVREACVKYDPRYCILGCLLQCIIDSLIIHLWVCALYWIHYCILRKCGKLTLARTRKKITHLAMIIALPPPVYFTSIILRLKILLPVMECGKRFYISNSVTWFRVSKIAKK